MSVDSIPTSPSKTAGPTTFQLGRRPFLDGLRGIAILLVLGWHWVRSPAGGFIGVDIFFVLSGFLITSLLLEEYEQAGRISFGAFYIRRGLRLLPALALVLIVYSVAMPFFAPDRDPHWYSTVLFAIFYAANWKEAFADFQAMGLLSQTWSLSLEEQFYMLTPLLLAFVLKRRMKRSNLIAIGLLLIIAVAAERSLILYSGGTISRIYHGFDTHSDGLLVGCILSLFVYSAWGMLSRHHVLIRALATISVFLLVGVVLIAQRDTRVYWTLVAPAVNLAVAAVILGLLASPPGLILKLLASVPIAWTGRLSYGIYLWHPLTFALVWPGFGVLSPAIEAVAGRLASLIGAGSPGWITALVGGFTGAALAFLLASASYYLLERRCLRLQAHFRPHQRVVLSRNPPLRARPLELTGSTPIGH